MERGQWREIRKARKREKESEQDRNDGRNPD